jgi:hypothetical protein
MKLNEWIIYGETGISSKTMWAAITGSYNEEYRYMEYRVFDIPKDADDFSRCYKFFKLCNLSDKHLRKVKEVFPFWGPYIDNWSELVRLYEENNSRVMYEYMCTLRDESDLIRHERKTH